MLDGMREHSFQDLTLFKQAESFCKETQFQGLMVEGSVVCINRMTGEVGQKKGRSQMVSIGQEGGWTPGPLWMSWRSENSLPYWDLNSNPHFQQNSAPSQTGWN
jgi:hypothetical protein